MVSIQIPIENGIVGLNGSKIAVGTIDEVGVSLRMIVTPHRRVVQFARAPTMEQVSFDEIY